MECVLRTRTSKQEPENFFDVLEERRRGSDIGHALRTFSAQPYRGATSLSVSALNRTVQESQYLRYVISEIAAESGEPCEGVKEEAVSILEEMSQNLQLSVIRLMGYAFTKVFKRLFSSILVNEDGLTRLQQAIQEHPVILMPNHRSYIDFLVLSYIMFTYDLSLPVIAAGIRKYLLETRENKTMLAFCFDLTSAITVPFPVCVTPPALMGMSLVGELLRRSGAFFIRRAIGSDKLYWAVLSEYVRTIVRTSFAPLEFYVEGLRSRTLKSLKPKLGMMQMVLEPFFKGEVYDITLVPISISYERVLEESLLAHELLGVPKPRETTRGLLKAGQVLEENYGCMHVHFGNPVSVRELAKGRIYPGHYNLIPRDLPVKLSAELQEFVGDVAHLSVLLQERGLVLSPWSLMALILLQNPDGVDWNMFTQKTLRLRTLAARFGARIHWPAQLPDSDVMTSSMALHQSVVRSENGHVRLVEESGPGPVTKEEAVLRRASAVLMCASYRNQALHVFTRPALVAVAMMTASSHSKDDVFSRFCFLQDVLANEFIFMPGHAAQDFEDGCSSLLRCGALIFDDGRLKAIEEEQDTIVFLRAALEPFIQTYQTVFRVLCEETFQTFTEKRFVPDVRASIMKPFLSGEVRSYECLSSDMQKNALSALVRMGAASKSMVAGQYEYRMDRSAVRRICDTLDAGVASQAPLYSRL